MATAKKTVTLATETTAPAFDMTLVLAALGAAVTTETAFDRQETRTAAAMVAFGDAVVATFGTMDVLAATSRSKAPDSHKAAYTALKDAYLTARWGADFVAWLDNSASKGMRAPAKGNGVKADRAYWLQQKGSLWAKFVGRVTSYIAAAKAAATPGADGTTGRAPNRKDKALDVACKENIAAAHKRVATAVQKQQDIPSAINVGAFLLFSELALAACETAKSHTQRVNAAMAALRAAKIVG